MEEKKKSNEIDIIGIIKKVLEDKRLLSKVCGIFAVIGIIVALNTQKSFTTTVVLAPETSDALGLGNKMGSISSMFGVNLGSSMGNDAIYPEIYPELFNSTDFIVPLFDIPVTLFTTNETKSYYDHIMNDVHIPFWSYPGIWIKELLPKDDEDDKKKESILDPFQLTKKQNGIYRTIKNNILCTVDKKTDVITITVKDYDKRVSAIIADSVTTHLQEFLTTYRTNKAKNDYQYMLSLYEEAKEKYDQARLDYAKYADSNQELSLESYRTKLADLENEMQLKFNIYSQITTMMQNAKAKIQERTPSFTIIQSATIPQKPSGTPRSLIVIGFVILGFIADATWIFWGRSIFKKNKN
jgi:hypothetical protein